MIAQDWSVVYANATEGTTVTIGGSNDATYPIMSVLFHGDRYESYFVRMEFLATDLGAGYATFIANIRALSTAISRAPRGRLTVKLGTSTEIDLDPDLATTGDLAFDADPELVVSPAPPNSGAARRISFVVRYRRPSDLTGQYGRSLGAHGQVLYSIQDRNVGVFRGNFTALPNQNAIVAYKAASPAGVDKYCRDWLAANAPALPAGGSWALVSDTITPTDTLSILDYKREYHETIGGRTESVTNVKAIPSGRRTVLVNGNYIETQTGGAKTALQNYADGTYGAAVFVAAQAQAVDGAAKFQVLYVTYKQEEKSEYLSFVGVAVELFTKQSTQDTGTGDPVIRNDHVEYEVSTAREGFSPDAQGPGMGISGAGIAVDTSGGGVPDNGTGVASLPGGSESGSGTVSKGGSGPSTSSGPGVSSGGTPGGSFATNAEPLLLVVIKFRADMLKSALIASGLNVEQYFVANQLPFYVAQAAQQLKITVVSVDGFLVKADPTYSLQAGWIRIKASSSPILYAEMDTTIMLDPGRLFRRIISRIAHKYLIQPGPLSGIKVREVRAIVRADSGPPVSSFVLGDHADDSGAGTWMVRGAPRVRVRNTRMGGAGPALGVGPYASLDVSLYQISQAFVYVVEQAGPSAGGSSSGASAPVTYTPGGSG